MRVRVGMWAEAVGKGHREGQLCLARGFWGETGRGGMGRLRVDLEERGISFGVVERHFSL